MNATSMDWHAKAATIDFTADLFIDGGFKPSASGKRFAVTSPIDGRHLADVAEGDAEDVDRAVKAARAAFEDGRWANRKPAARKQVLLAFADLIEANRADLALTETLDMGKPIGDSFAIDVRATANCFRWYAEAIDKVYDEVAPSGPGDLALITREPLGVVAAVVPWNFPMIMAAWKLAPALAAGNSVILKPAEQSSLTALKLAALALEAGIPPGVLNVITGYGPTAGKALGLHMDVDGVFFTGSTEVGKLFLQYAGQSNMKRVGLECGGKSPHVVLASSNRLDAAASAAADAIFFNQGEVCTAGSRLIVERPMVDALVEKIKQKAAGYQPGDPLDASTRLGAIVDETQLKRVLSYVDIARADGAEVVMGGKQARLDSGGFYVEPTIFGKVTNDMRVAREEIFGPMLSVIIADDKDHALRIANDTIYGLAAAVWTDDLTTAHQFARGLRAGMVYVNCYDGDDITVPFGGYKQSGIGRDKSLHAFEKYTELKTTWIKLG